MNLTIYSILEENQHIGCMPENIPCVTILLVVVVVDLVVAGEPSPPGLAVTVDT